ncbi:hypothetical protein FPOAC2_04536 [Fusarium poae]
MLHGTFEPKTSLYGQFDARPYGETQYPDTFSATNNMDDSYLFIPLRIVRKPIPEPNNRDYRKGLVVVKMLDIFAQNPIQHGLRSTSLETTSGCKFRVRKKVVPCNLEQNPPLKLWLPLQRDVWSNPS